MIEMIDCLAAGDMSWPSAGETVLRVVAIIFFLLLNAFFVASEFSVVKVRKSQLDAVSEDSDVSPQKLKNAQSVVDNLDGFLSATQLGITLASIALGALGEPFVSKILENIFVQIGFDGVLQSVATSLQRLPLLGFVKASTFTHTIAFLLSYAIITYLHVVIGELLPKSIAIRKALATTIVCSGPLIFFYKIFNWAIRLLNGNANWILKKIFGIDPISEGESVHSAEELALLVTESETAKEVTETEREILINALELNDLFVRDIMTPRAEVVALDVEKEFSENWALALKTKHTRFPLVNGHLDSSVGLVHIKDMLTLFQDENPDLLRIKRELKVVPETMPLDVLLKFFLKEHQHLVMVVDEYGSPVGLVFLDDVIEEIVGDIHDEFDNETSSFTRVSDTEFVVEGGLTLNILSDHVPELDFDSGEVTTVGGYITQKLGRFPAVGESLSINDYEATVTSIDNRRVGQIHFRHLNQG